MYNRVMCLALLKQKFGTGIVVGYLFILLELECYIHPNDGKILEVSTLVLKCCALSRLSLNDL